jgi:hypothetical protein
MARSKLERTCFAVESSEHSNGINLSDILSADRYPDLIRLGGLAEALRQLSLAHGVDVGEIRSLSESGPSRYKTAKMDSERGPVVVLLGLESRIFSISIDSSSATFVWASGGTNDLREVLGVMDYWRRGVVLRELGERFPFMTYSRLSQGYEDGIPVETQWNILLSAEEYLSHQDLLQAVYSNDDLRGMFPFFSHSLLRLARDCFDRTAGEVKIDRRSDGSYMVESRSNRGSSRREAFQMDEAIRVAHAFSRDL